MLFSELYSSYYNAVAAILTKATEHPLQDGELRSLAEQYAFGESMVNIPVALREERWQLLRPDGTTPIQHKPEMPLTTLQKRWLKAIAMDPRIRLFGDFSYDFPDVEPLYYPGDILLFDRYADGDDFEDEAYIARFRMILDAIRKKIPLEIVTQNRMGKTIKRTIDPVYLEYSEKDDKFRLVGRGGKFGNTINLGRVIRCRLSEKNYVTCKSPVIKPCMVTLELVDERNALERVLLHFAHFKKQVEKLSANQYRLTIEYDKNDETEMVIRVLSFGPVIKAVAPEEFVSCIKQRLMNQKSCVQ